MNPQLITATSPKLLTGGVELFGLAASQEIPPGFHHALKPMEFCTIESIQIRAETMTPLLQEILDYRPAARWGSNE